MDTVSTEVLVVGGGVTGLAVAREFSSLGHDVILVERNHRIAEEVSARNSGVIHAGFYYPKNSLKSSLCHQGNQMIYRYCKSREIFTKRTGKLLLANSDADNKKINQYIANADHYGGDPLLIKDRKTLKKMEPLVTAEFAMYSPETGIVDVHEFCNSLANEFVSLGGNLSLRTTLKSFAKSGSNFSSIVETEGVEFKIKSKTVICALGLHSFDLSKNKELHIKGIKELNYTKGQYFKLKGASPFNSLIYPMPTFYGLGIHAGFDIDGSVRFGPDTVSARDLDYSFSAGAKEKFIKAIKLYFPTIESSDLTEDYVGIRPKIQSPDESFADFSVLSFADHGINNLVCLQGIESPGLTCSLAMAKYIYNTIH